MTTRNFSNVTTVGTLTGPASSSGTSLSLTNFSNNPTVPFTATIDRNTATEEIVLVTALLSSTATVVRGYDGTAAQTHAAGATFEHTAGAIEYNEANRHVNATSDVHGVTGSLVGAQGSQNLYDKTLVSPVLQADVTSGDASVAYIPPGAESKNLYTGIGSDGATKFSVSSGGALQAQTVQSVGLMTATGGLTVGGASTLTGAASLNGGATVPAGKTLTVSGTIAGGATATLGATTTSTLHATGVATLDTDAHVGGGLSVVGGINVLSSATVASLIVSGGGTVATQGTTVDAVVRKDYVDSYHPAGSLTGSSTQSVPHNATTVLTLGVQATTNIGTMTSDLATGKLIIGTAGQYSVSGSVAFAGNNTGRRVPSIYKNGAIVQNSATHNGIGSGSPVQHATATVLLDLAAGDYLQLAAYQDSGAALNADRTLSFIQAHRVA